MGSEIGSEMGGVLPSFIDPLIQRDFGRAPWARCFSPGPVLASVSSRGRRVSVQLLPYPRVVDLGRCPRRD